MGLPGLGRGQRGHRARDKAGHIVPEPVLDVLARFRDPGDPAPPVARVRVLAGVFAAFVAGMAILERGGVATVSWSDEGTARVVLGTAAYVVGIGLIGLALGLLLRSTAGAISALLAGVLVLPTLAGALLPEAWDGLLEYLPSNAASAFTSNVPTDSLLSSGTGALVFVAWIVAGLAAAAVALTRRDA